ncbi:MAG: hypothetical protein P4L64_09605 [Caulobacteraceae bacterium]|nr:hypothetical protein [Caulobacteraceae bacterium]
MKRALLYVRLTAIVIVTCGLIFALAAPLHTISIKVDLPPAAVGPESERAKASPAASRAEPYFALVGQGFEALVIIGILADGVFTARYLIRRYRWETETRQDEPQ